MKPHRLNVFVNAPFDDDYAPLLDALIFTIYACGLRARCALEENDSGDIRLDKLIRIVRNFLAETPAGGPLPGPAKLAETFAHFSAELPALAQEIEHEPQEIGGLKSYPTFLWCVAEFLKRVN